MTAHEVRRHGWRLRLALTLAWPACLFCGNCWSAEPDPPDPAAGPPAAAPLPAPDIDLRVDRLPDPPPDASQPDSAPPDRPPRRSLPDSAPPAALAAAADRPASPPGPLAAPDAAAPLDLNPRLEAQFRTRRSLNHVLYRDRRYRLLLEQAQDALANDQPLIAFDALRELSAADEDVFLWDEASQTPISARTSGRRLIAHLAPAERERYERYVGAAATAALETAIGSGAFDALQRVAREFPGTVAAGRSSRLIAAQLLDAGRVAEAVAIWQEIIASEGIARLTERDRLLAAESARLANNAALLARVSAVEDQSPGTASACRPTVLASPHWMLPGGEAGGYRLAGGRLPTTCRSGLCLRRLQSFRDHPILPSQTPPTRWAP